MASFKELQRDYGWRYAFKEAWESLKWYKLNLLGWLSDLKGEGTH